MTTAHGPGAHWGTASSVRTSFPGDGHPWVAALGAYDEHLVRDVVFHLAHLDGYDTVHALGNGVALGGSVVLAAVLLLPTGKPARDAVPVPVGGAA